MKKKFLKVSLLLLLVCVFVCGCGNKKAITVDQFNDKMTKNEYTMVDAKDQFSQYDYVQDVYIAVDKTTKYQIEFYVLGSTENAASFVETNRKIFEDEKTSPNAETDIKAANYEKYTLSSNKKYKVLSRIDNTVIYVNVSDKYKDEVNKVLKELGY